jgi:putative (di)nucleoside polyphosphate hydrolase
VMPILLKDREAYVLLGIEKRFDNNNFSRRLTQYCLFGGKREITDLNSIYTSVREFWEETGRILDLKKIYEEISQSSDGVLWAPTSKYSLYFWVTKNEDLEKLPEKFASLENKPPDTEMMSLKWMKLSDLLKRAISDDQGDPISLASFIGTILRSKSCWHYLLSFLPAKQAREIFEKRQMTVPPKKEITNPYADYQGKLSAGFLILSKNSKHLLCHATKKKNDIPEQFDGCWTISKGMVEQGEGPIDAAIRELKEETGIDLLNFPQLVPNYSQKPMKYNLKNKLVLVWLIDDKEGLIESSNIKFACTSLIDNPNPKVKHLNGLPEMDGFMWATREEATRMVMKSQKFLFQDSKDDFTARHIHGHEQKCMSAGFLIISKNSKYLLCHATTKPDQKPEPSDGNWTISKGMVEKGEGPLDAAIRELKEETGIDLPKQFPQLVPFQDCKPIVYHSTTKKNLIYVIDDKEGLIESSNHKFVCTSLIDNPDPKVKHLNGLPEMDGFMWATSEEALPMVFNNQRFLFQSIPLSSHYEEETKQEVKKSKHRLNGDHEEHQELKTVTVHKEPPKQISQNQ